MIKLQWRLTSI